MRDLGAAVARDILSRERVARRVLKGLLVLWRLIVRLLSIVESPPEFVLELRAASILACRLRRDCPRPRRR